MTMFNARTREEVKEIVEDFGYKLLDEYMDKSQRRVVIIDNDDYRYDVNFYSIIRGYPPNFVDVRNPFVLYNISLWLERENKPFILCENNIFRSAREKLFFRCLREECQEVFDSTWTNIYSHGNNCPFCSGRRVGKHNNLSYLRPELEEEWDYEKNKKNPDEYTEFSTERVSWICINCKHHWVASIQDRSNGKDCPACVGRIVTDRNRLSILFPEISLEWDYNKNHDTPNDVSFAKNEKRWWVCKNGHSYSSYISNRTGKNKNSCKQCSDEQKESTIANELKIYFKQNYNAIPEYKILKNPETNRWLPYDIYIPNGYTPELNGFYIEVHWEHHYRLCLWHKKQADRNGTTSEEEFKYQKHKDRLKRKFAKNNGVYIEIDLRKIKTIESAIKHFENVKKTLE